MRILLVHASHITQGGSLVKGKKAWIHGITLPLLAAVTPKEAEVHLCNDSVHSLPIDEEWDLVGISIMGISLFRAIRIAQLFRSKGCYIVMGGKILNQLHHLAAPHTDAIVLGEAEDVWPRIIRDAQNKKLQPVYGDPHHLTDIGSLPVPRYDLVDRSRHGIFFPIESSRGCPHHCDFCVASPWSQHNHRVRPIAHVIRDIKALKKLNIRHMAFMDDNLTADKDYAFELFKAMKPLQIHWISQLGTEVINDSRLMSAAADAGCSGVSIGFESILQENLDSVNKGFNKVDDYKDGLDYLHHLGIVVAPLIVLGFDHDSPGAFKKLIAFLDTIHIAFPLLYILTPAPGSTLYKRLESENRIIQNDLNYYNLMHAVFKPALMSPSSLEKEFWWTYQKLYSIPRILKRTVHQSGSLTKRVITFFINMTIRSHVFHQRLPGSY